MTTHSNGYAENRRSGRNVTRMVTELPSELVQAIDEWGVSAGMTSRRETTETLLKRGLEADNAKT